jgi:hypothetical protein
MAAAGSAQVFDTEGRRALHLGVSGPLRDVVLPGAVVLFGANHHHRRAADARRDSNWRFTFEECGCRRYED